MKKLLQGFILMLCCSALLAAPIKKIIFFGDSLTDNGNLYKFLVNILPKSPPYFSGRFSNGPTWAEWVGKHFQTTYDADYAVYAVGGATAGAHIPTPKFIYLSTLKSQVYKYLLEDGFKNKSKNVYTIWIGSNDYLFYDHDNPDYLTSYVVGKISHSLKMLIAAGAKQFLVINTPDLSRVPLAKSRNSLSTLRELSEMHNKKLLVTVENLRNEYPKVQIAYLDVFNLLNDVIDHPDKYNQMYDTRINQTHNACWPGGMYMTNAIDQSLQSELQQTIKQNGTLLSDEEATGMKEYILSNPFLAYEYGQNHALKRGSPCQNADEYLFWDDVHPTMVIHKVLAQIIVDKISKDIQL